MPKRTIEGDVLQIMSADLIAAIADQLDLALFGEVVSGAGFIPDQTVCGIISIGGITKFEKVSKIMSAVRSNITNLLTQDKVTEKFDAFVLLLRDSLRLDDIAKDLADALSAKKPGYTSPLIEGAVANPDVRSKQESAAQIPLARAIQSFSEEMTTEELQPWLLSTQMPQKDRKIFEENGIGGIVFLRSSEEDRKNLKISSVGLIVWNRLIEKISSPADVGQAVSTNDAVCASVDIDGSASAQSQEKETVGNKYPGWTGDAAPTLQLVCEELAPVRYKWFEICIQLGVPYERLMDFKTQQDPLAASVTYWLRGNVEGFPVSWRSVVAALKSGHVGETGIAKLISQKYCLQEENEDCDGRGRVQTDSSGIQPIPEAKKLKYMSPLMEGAASNSDYGEYVSMLPETARGYLKNVLDWDGKGVDKDLNKIAYSMIDWEENLSSRLGFSNADIVTLKRDHSDRDELLRRAVLRKWKELKGSHATYGELLRVCCEEHVASVADAICDVLRSRVGKQCDKYHI